LAGETELLGENLPQCHFVHNQSNMTLNRTQAVGVGSLPELSYDKARLWRTAWQVGNIALYEELIGPFQEARYATELDKT
jgi:hypothetical protein